MLGEPGGGPDPDGPAIRLRRASAPWVGMDRQVDAVTIVQVPGRLAAVFDKVLEVREEGCHALLLVPRLGAPVVHLQVDVVMQVALPRRVEVLAPFAL